MASVLNVASLQNAALAKRREWESAFDLNNKSFVLDTAATLGEQILGKLCFLEDPFKERPHAKRPYVIHFSFEMGRPRQIAEIQHWAKKSAELQPFKEWFEKLGVEPKTVKEEQELSSVSFKLSREEQREMKIDIEYFQELMAFVGLEVRDQLERFLQQQTSTQENASLKYRVTWHREKDQLVNNPSAFKKDNNLTVELWLEEKAQSVSPAAVSYQPPTTIAKIQAKKAVQVRKQQLIQYGIMGAVALVAYLFFFSGIFSKK